MSYVAPLAPAVPSVSARDELFGPDRLEQHAPVLAASHAVLPGRHPGRPLLSRLRSNLAALHRGRRIVGRSIRSGEPLAPAAEWLIENFPVVEEQLREVTRDLPRGFYRELPKLADGAAARADLSSASGGSRDDDLAAARADADAATARAVLSAETARRTETLFAQGVATAAERDEAVQTAAADASAARAAAARRASAAASSGEAVRLADARLDAAVARRDQAAAALDQLTLRAPIAGEVLQVRVRPGEHATPGSVGALVLGDTSQLRARLDIDERDATRVAVDQPAEIRVEGLADPQPGHVVEVGRRVGRKNVRTDDPTDRQDARFVEVVVALDAAPAVPIGVRVDGSIRLVP